MNTAVLFTLLLSLLPIFLFLSRKKSSKRLPPGSLGIPLIGQSLSFLRASQTNTGVKWLKNRVEKYGPISKLSLFGTPTVFLVGPAANRFVFTNDGTVLNNQQSQPTRRLLGERNLTELRGEDHKRVREAIGLFLKPEMLKKYVGEIDGVVRQHLEMHWRGRPMVKVNPLMKTLTFDIICSLFFGLEQGAQRDKLLKDFHDMTTGLWSIPINFPFTRFNHSLRASRRIRRLVRDLVLKKMVALKHGEASLQYDLIACLLSIHGEDITDKIIEEVVDNAIVVMLAGYETSSSVITFLIRFLAKDPVVYNFVLREHEEIMKSKAIGEPLTWEDLAKMKLTWRAAMETMRMIPPVFGTFRRVVKDFEYEGYLIPKGWQIFWASTSTHMDEQIFPEPWKFDPERFNNQASIPRYSFVPFGGGMRICPGSEFARIETLITIHYLITQFSWKLGRSDDFLGWNPMPLPSEGLPIQIEPKTL